MTAPSDPIRTAALAKALSAVATAGFGRELRGGTNTDELDEISGVLASDATVPKFVQYEEAIEPSITRLGKGRYGKLARGIFGLTPTTEGLPSRKKRVKQLEAELSLSEAVIKADLDKMFRALAEDLIGRYNALVAQ